MPEDFERRVRQKIEEISRSQEIKNIKRDFGNIARDVKKEFSSYQGNHTGQQQESQQRYHVGPNQYGSSQKIMHPIRRQSADTRQSVSPASCSPSLAAWA